MHTTEEQNEQQLAKLKELLADGIDAVIPHPTVALMTLLMAVEQVRVRVSDDDPGVTFGDLLALEHSEAVILKAIAPDWAGGLDDLLETCRLLAAG